jgi:hypothetical protein
MNISTLIAGIGCNFFLKNQTVHADLKSKLFYQSANINNTYHKKGQLKIVGAFTD